MSFTRCLRRTAVLAGSLAVGFAQIGSGTIGSVLGGVQPPRSTEHHDVTGSVVNSVTGEPIRKALVTLQSGDGPHTTFTDPAGRFTLEAIPDGQYGLMTEKPGFSNGSPGRPGPASGVNVSADSPPIQLMLTPNASVTGRVLDVQGRGLEGVTVQAERFLISEGRGTWAQSRGTSSDEDGTYELEDLEPGKYRLRTAMRMAPEIAPVGRQTPISQLRHFVYPTSYVGRAATPDGQQPLDLAPGQRAQADFEVRAVPGFRVSGAVAPAIGPAFVELEDEGGNPQQLDSPVNFQTSRFVLPAVPAGSWRLVVQGGTPKGAFWGAREISVDRTDLPNVLVQPDALPNVPVHILYPGFDSPPSVNVMLFRADSSHTGPIYSASPAEPAKPNPDSLQFAGVVPGVYRVITQSFAPGNAAGSSCVESVRAGATDVLRDGLTISQGGSAPDVTVTLRSDCASLRVTVNMSSGAPYATGLLVADEPGLEPVRTMLAKTPGDGHEGLGEFRNLTPGAYRLYVFDDISNLEYRNPEVMRQFSSQEITLGPNENAKATAESVARAK